ncbi:hypothetical protein [Tomitella gaofuii]|uniref:hypothetical protein n=1 Tax=Tomitella gaofuii TaxID=2760083 RepID=UPI0015F7DE08|nr:hypothetical protein [Tomitella gaofuii]
MRSHTYWWILGGAGAAIAVLLVALLVIPGADESDTTGDTTDVAVPSLSLGRAADQVATEALTTIYTWQPATDASPGVGLTRAARWLTGDLAAAAAAPPADPPIRPPQWSAWARSGDVLRASAEVIDRPTTTETEATRTVRVRQQIMHATGDLTPREPVVATVHLVRGGGSWLIDDYRVLPGRN